MSTVNAPHALTIAGSDSGGEAGIQADLQVFAALGVHGTTALTCITAQNRSCVVAIEPCTPRIVRQQILAVGKAYSPAAVKTGMLYSPAIIRSVAETLRTFQRIPLVVDPVLAATSGASLAQPRALTAWKTYLLPLASLVTPNLREATALTGERIRSPEEMRAAARRLHGEFGCAVLVKGGHLVSSAEAVDLFFDGRNELLLSAPFRSRVHLHGTGCRLSAAIAAFLARGHDLTRAVELGKQFITDWIAEQSERRVARASRQKSS